MRSHYSSSARRHLRRAVFGIVTVGVVASMMVCAQRDASAQVVFVAPPAPRVEIVAETTAPGYFWIPGYWSYRAGAGYTWCDGRWEGVRSGYAWRHAHWPREGRRWHFAPGRGYGRR